MSVQSLPGSSACANATTIRLTGDVGPVGKRAATILARIIAERLTPPGGNTFTKNVPGGDVELRIDPGLSPDAFAIDRLTDNAAVVRGGDGRGLLSGCGRLVRRSRIGRAGIRFCESQPVSVPGKSLRGMYAAQIIEFPAPIQRPSPSVQRVDSCHSPSTPSKISATGQRKSRLASSMVSSRAKGCNTQWPVASRRKISMRRASRLTRAYSCNASSWR